MTKDNERNAKQPDPIEQAFAQVGRKRKYSEGDIVRWGGELFQIDGCVYEAVRNSIEHSEEIMYAMSRVVGDGSWNDFAEVYQDDEELTLECRAEFAAEYIANLPMNGGRQAQEGAGIVYIEFSYGDSKSEKPAESHHRDREKAEIARRKRYRARVDELLDAYNDAVRAGESEAAASIRREYERAAVIFDAGGYPEKEATHEG